MTSSGSAPYNNSNGNASTSFAEIAHYVVTAHPPGSVLSTAKCNFVAATSVDVLIAKSGRLEVRQLRAAIIENNNRDTSQQQQQETSSPAIADLANPFPLLFQVPMYGRVTEMVPFTLYNSATSLVFFLTDRHQYGVIGCDSNYNSTTGSNSGSLYPIVTHASGSVSAASFWAQGAVGSGALSGSSVGTSSGAISGDMISGGSGVGGGTGVGSGTSPWTNENALAVLGREVEGGPAVIVDPLNLCIVMHLHSGLLAIIPIQRQYNPSKAMQDHQRPKYKNDSTINTPTRSSASLSSPSCLGHLFHCRIEERSVLAISFLQFPVGGPDVLPHICILHQDARGVQHVTTHVLNLQKRQLYLMQTTALAQEGAVEWLRKTAVDGGSTMLLSVPPPPPPPAAAAAMTASSNTTSMVTATDTPPTSGGVIVVGQRQFTYCSSTTTKIIPVPQALYLSSTDLPADPNGMPRFLLSDEFGNLHMLTLLLTNPTSTASSLVLGLQLETLGSCNLCRDLCYLGHGLVYAASHLGDSQLIQIHDEPIPVEGAALSAAASGRRGTSAMDEESDTAGATNAAAALDTDMDVLLADTTYIQVVEEYTNLGPILDFDLVPTAPPTNNPSAGGSNAIMDGKASPASAAAPAVTNPSPHAIQQSQVVTCSGTSKMGSLRLIRNGIGMNEYASVEIPGISNMWSLRQAYKDVNDTYLVQSFVGQTRVLGVTLTRGEGEDDDGDKAMTSAEGAENVEDEEQFGSLEEVVLPGLESNSSTLYVGNLEEDRILQITESEIRLIGPFAEGGQVLDSWSNGPITVAAANESGQVALAQHGGHVLYFQVKNDSIEKVAEREMEQEVSCLDLHPFQKRAKGGENSMDVEGRDTPSVVDTRVPVSSRWLAVGLWDDFTVRLLDLENTNLDEAQKLYLSSQPEGEVEGEDAELLSTPGRRNRNNMMARSLCLITLDFSSSTNNNPHNPGGAAASHQHKASASQGVDMLFVGLGDGSLISFVVLLDREGQVSIRSKKEVCLGTQRIDLIPLSTQGGGSCVLATGDRPTVIYLAGIGGGQSSSAHFNPKLCYSSVNLSASEDDEIDDSVSRPPAHQSIAVNVASPFYSPLLFDSTSATTAGSSSTSQHYSLCIADETSLRLGVIDDIQKLHVTTCRLGMAPRRIVHCMDGRLFAVGCIESGIKHLGTSEAINSMGNCIRFMDDTNFDDIKRVDLDPFETILCMAYVTMSVPDREGSGSERHSIDANPIPLYKSFLIVGTGYSMPDESEITRGRILLFSCEADENSASGSRTVRQFTELSTNGGVFSACQFYDGTILCAVNSKTMVCRLHDDAGLTSLQFIGVGHHGHILSMFLKSGARAPQFSNGPESPTTAAQHLSLDVGKARSESSKKEKKPAPQEMLAIVGDLMRSVSVLQYFPEHQILEEIARDYNANWTTAIEMINDDIYLAGEHWCNLYCLRRNKHAASEEVRGRLDIVGEYHLAEMCNKFMSGSLVMPVAANSGSTVSNRRQQKSRLAGSGKTTSSESPEKSPANNARAARRPVVVTGSQTLFGTVDGSLGVILGLDGRTAAFFTTLERAMAKVIRPIGDLSHQMFRAFQGERRRHPAHGFVDGDLVESFLDLDRHTMEAVVTEMNRDGGWEVDEVVNSARNNTNEAAASSSTAAAEEEITQELSVDDVVAMVEEISMLH